MSRSKWETNTAENPCKICKHGDWCQVTEDGAVQKCMRVPEGAFKSTETNAGTAHFHELIPRTQLPGYKPVTAEWNGQPADADTRHTVYGRLLAESSYSDSHRLELVKRKAPLPFGLHRYGTLRKQGLSKIIAKLREEFSDEVLLSVPGFVVKRSTKGELYVTINGKPGLMIPVRDDAGRILAIKIRIDGAAAAGKYRWLSSKKTKWLPFDGPAPGVAVHCPLLLKKDRPLTTVRVTEGILKADVANANSDVPTIAADSVGTFTRTLVMIEALGASVVRIASDMDREKNPQVAAATLRFATVLAEKQIDVEFEKWPASHKGIDDALVAGATIEVIAGEDALCYLVILEAVAKRNSDVDDGRREITITHDEHETNDAAVDALKLDHEIYQRSGSLVWIVRGEDRNDGIRRPENAARIVTMKLATIRERLSRVARFGVLAETDEGEKFERKPVPQKVVEAVAARGSWPGIRTLAGVVTTPILRRDGSILSTPGYDNATCLLFDPQGVEFSILEKPSLEDAKAAAARLLDLVADFPFAVPSHRSAWLAGLLTPLARHAFAGPSPLFLFDANVRGAGKTLLAELISLILTSGDFSRMSNPQDDTECRKLITSLVLCGDTLVLIDNIAGILGCAALDAALTGTVWKDRRLGANEIIIGSLLMTWYASGNNIILNGDTVRRTCQARLESPEEKPEERTAFKYPNLAAHVREHRPALLADVLTILSAYCLAGRPKASLKPWGSFEGWSDLVRQAVVWCGLDDPGQTRQELTDRSDRDAEHLRELIAGWQEIDLDCSGLTCADALDRLSRGKQGDYPRLRNVLADAYDLKPGELPGARKLGKKLQHLRGRVCGGKAFSDSKENRDKVKLWRVVDLAKPTPSAGYGGYAGYQPALISRDKVTDVSDTTHTHTREERAVAHPASTAQPATITHDDELCDSKDSWLCTNGQRYCRACKPPLSASVVVQEGSAA